MTSPHLHLNSSTPPIISPSPANFVHMNGTFSLPSSPSASIMAATVSYDISITEMDTVGERSFMPSMTVIIITSPSTPPNQ